MRGSPVEDHANSGLVASVNELHKFLRRTVAAGGGEVTKSLVTPGAVVRMLHDGKQLDVGVAEFLDVRNELIAELAVGEPAIVILGDAAPGAEMNFVNGNGGLEPVFGRALGEPVRVVPAMRFEIGDDRAGVWSQLGAEGVGIGFERKHVSVRTDDFEFVDGAFGEFGDEDFPDS